MITYKYSIDDIYDRPLISERPKEGKRGWLATVAFLPLLGIIAVVLLIYGPVKAVQLLVERFSE